MMRNQYLERCLEISRTNMNLRASLRQAGAQIGALTKQVNRMMIFALVGWGLAVALLLGWCP